MILSLYLPYIRLRKRSWQVDERILRQHILPTFARHLLQDISRNDVEIWLGLLAAKGLAPATCNRILSSFQERLFTGGHLGSAACFTVHGHRSVPDPATAGAIPDAA